MFQAILKFFQNLFKSPSLLRFEEFCGQVFTAEKTLLLASLQDFAISAVQTAQGTGLDSSAKRTQAFNEITAKAQTAGIVVGASAIALALEMAYTALKNNQGNKGIVDGKPS